MGTNGSIGFEQKLWQTADKLRSNMDPSEYKYVVLGLIFLKYISDAYEEVEKENKKEIDEADDEDEIRDIFLEKNAFWVPKKARWNYLQENAKQASVGELIDNAMDLIEKENPSLKGVLPKDYARPTLDKRRLGELIDLIGSIALGDKESKKKDILGQVYEYFLGQFADAEGKKGGQFYTPRSIVQTLVYMIRPYKGRVYDPCCGSGGMFVQSEEFVKEHQGKINNISIYGQESNSTTWKLAKMNLAIRGIESKIGLGDTFHDDKYPDLKADFILANPPFNVSDYGADLLQDDVRWKFGVPPAGNANFAWMQHFIHHLSSNGVAGFVLANGSMSSNTSNEGNIRRKIIEAGLVDCIIALPSQLFYNTQIPCCLWFLRRGKTTRKEEVLFIDARKMGQMISRRNKELTKEEIVKISDTYHSWLGEDCENGSKQKYEDVVGFCKNATLADIEKNDFILTPGRYVGFVDDEIDDKTFEEKMKELTKQLKESFEKEAELNEEIKKNLEKVGFKI
jgi:type I restriction enzyme M protein